MRADGDAKSAFLNLLEDFAGVAAVLHIIILDGTLWELERNENFER